MRSGGGIGHLLPLRFFLGVAEADGQEHLDCVLPNGGNHLIEHIEAFDAVFHNGVTLGVGAKVNAFPQLFHGVDVIHPLGINVPQEHHTFHFPHPVGTDLLLFFLVLGDGLFIEDVDDVLFLHAAQFVGGELQIAGLGEEA